MMEAELAGTDTLLCVNVYRVVEVVTSFTVIVRSNVDGLAAAFVTLTLTGVGVPYG